jgi:predicted N-formylglutamate amidohydrolase
LGTHHAYDLGIYPIARKLARRLHCPLFAFSVTRLLVDVNRSIGHRRLLSEFSRGLPTHEKKHLIQAYYQPYRESVAKAIERHVARGQHVLHISLHSFTPVVKERVRNADIGLLYDPRCLVEKHLAKRLHGQLAGSTGLRVRRNYPYRGAADGFVTSLRRQFVENVYSGLEIELNQRLLEKWPMEKSRCATEDLVGVLSGSVAPLLQVGSRPA